MPESQNVEYESNWNEEYLRYISTFYTRYGGHCFSDLLLRESAIIWDLLDTHKTAAGGDEGEKR